MVARTHAMAPRAPSLAAPVRADAAPTAARRPHGTAAALTEGARLADRSITFLLLRAAAAGESRLARLARQEGLRSAAMLRVLLTLLDAPPAGDKVTAVARQAALRQPTATKLLASAASLGLVQRREDPQGDRRVVRVVLSPRGHSVATAAAATLAAQDRALAAAWAGQNPGALALLAAGLA